MYELIIKMPASTVIHMWKWCTQNLNDNTWDYESTKEPDHNLLENEEVRYIWKFKNFTEYQKFLEKINEVN